MNRMVGLLAGAGLLSYAVTAWAVGSASGGLQGAGDMPLAAIFVFGILGFPMMIPWFLSTINGKQPPVGRRWAAAGASILAADLGFSLALAISSPLTGAVGAVGGVAVIVWAEGVARPKPGNKD